MVVDAVRTTFQGETQFAGYADSSRGGPRITLRLADRADLEKFIGCEGKRYMAVLVEIGDDEKPAAAPSPAPQKSPARERMAPLCEWAVMACKTQTFQRWAFEQPKALKLTRGLSMEEQARSLILSVCGVSSRKSLDTEPAAAKKLHEFVRKPYVKWLQEQGVTA